MSDNFEIQELCGEVLIDASAVTPEVILRMTLAR